ncbi:hypothetical protein O181_021424 [Austropuccinia psidii MF-1]|uniref:Reverse transcriptase Ty1/copia-type domain-containing protein n=1 Tax=Austropuccinia psidii MF-1 TaxID=1389203 RepID=A0A9Q3CAS5_9BASI|nr:hypothetical protein [Austropuccinia psidii MF-1]
MKLHSIVGVDVKRVVKQFRLSQHHLIKKRLVGHTNNFSPRQPLSNLKLKSDVARQADRAYLSKVGMILYLAQATRPDVMYATNCLAQFSMATIESHWLALKNLISYLAATIEADLGRSAVEMFVDSNWASKGSRSQHGYIGMMWGVPVMWNSKRQSCIALSTFQAEYMALAFEAKRFTWFIDNFACVLKYFVPTLYSDNMAAIKVENNEGSRNKAQHIEREFHVINEMVVKKKVVISWINSLDQLADIFTKNLAANKVEIFKDCIGCKPIFVEGSVKNA